jgi:hypothetical protein
MRKAAVRIVSVNMGSLSSCFTELERGVLTSLGLTVIATETNETLSSIPGATRFSEK